MAQSIDSRTGGWSIRTRVGWGLMTLGSLLLVLFAMPYLAMNPETYFERQRSVYEAHETWIIAHIAFMIVPALLGPTQFLRSFRNRYPRAHRVAGRLYIFFAICGAIAGLYMAQYAASGAAAGWGFVFLAIGVLITTGTAFYMILNGRLQSHREWMTRSYALIFAAVTLRLYLPILEAVFGEENGYIVTAWLCWIPNILVAEWIIRTHLRRKPERDFERRTSSMTTASG